MTARVISGPPECHKHSHLSLGVLFYNQIKKWDPLRTIIVDNDDQNITYKKLLHDTVALAKKLQQLGIQKGDVLTIVSHNQYKVMVTVLAGFYVGATCNLLNNSYTSGELSHFLKTCKPKIIFATAKCFNSLSKLKDEPYFAEFTVLYDGDPVFQEFMYEELIEQLDEKEIESFEPKELNPEKEVALILTSSGTTGLPKCVQITHLNIHVVLTYAQDPQFLQINETENLIVFLPLFHIFGLALTLAGIICSAKCVLIEKFVPDRFLSILQDHKITKLFLVPPILLFLVKSPLVQKYDLSSLKDILCGAAPCPKELEETIEKQLEVKSVRQLYGLTESSGGVTIVSKNEKKRFGSVGKVANCCMIKVCDPENGQLLPAHKVGELRVKGKGIMKGYLDNEEETKNAFDEEGFLKTGDLGYYDDEDFFYVVDRLKELIKYKGFQVAPAELESLLLQHPSVRDAGVVGKPDPRAGEVPVAFIVKQPKAEVTEEELLGYVAENLSVQKHLYGGVKFVEEIPKNPSGKVLRRKLKEML